MTKILNLTQHVSTPEQIEVGVIEPEIVDKEKIQKLLTFEEIPSRWKMTNNAITLAQIAREYYRYDPEYNSGRCIPKIMIGGAPYFMSELEKQITDYMMEPVYAFSKRESVDQVQPDGSVRKVAVFRHCGFVEV